MSRRFSSPPSSIYENYRAASEIGSTLAPSRRLRNAKRNRVDPSDWSFFPVIRGNVVDKLPAGEYYIGDIGRVLSEDVYHGVFGTKAGYNFGLFEKKGTDNIFLVNGTKYGDGEYSCSHTGKKFLVDSGCIGICSKSLMDDRDGYGGHVFTFATTVQCNLSGGQFKFTDGSTCVFIDTTTSSHESSDSEESEEEEDFF